MGKASAKRRENERKQALSRLMRGRTYMNLAIVTIQRAWRKYSTAARIPNNKIQDTDNAMQVLGSVAEDMSLIQELENTMTSSCARKAGTNAEDSERLQSSVDHLTQQVDSLRREMREGFLRLGVIS